MPGGDVALPWPVLFRYIRYNPSVTALTSEIVRTIPHLESLTPADAALVAERLILTSYGPREIVAMEGEPCRGYFFLLEGRARLFRGGADGREQIMRLLEPGDSFAEVAVFDNGSTPASIETLEESRVVLVPAALFRTLVETHPAIAADLLAYFARRLRSFTELVEQISFQTVQQRVARYIYYAAREHGIETPEGVVVRRAITLQDLASLVGSVREVVSRTLHVLETEKIVILNRKEFLILDLEVLKKLL